MMKAQPASVPAASTTRGTSPKTKRTRRLPMGGSSQLFCTGGVRFSRTAVCSLRAAAVEGPGDGNPGVGVVAAVRPCADRHLEVTAQRRVDIDSMSDDRRGVAGRRHARPLGWRRGPPVAPANPDRSRELVGERVDLGLDVGDTAQIVVATGLFEVLAELVEPAAIGLLRCGIEGGTSGVD